MSEELVVESNVAVMEDTKFQLPAEIDRETYLREVTDMLQDLQIGQERFLSAAKKYVRLVKINPDLKNYLMKKKFSPVFLSGLERLGSGELHPSLFLTPLQNTRLPRSEQDRLVENPMVEHVVLNPKTNEVTHELVDILKSTPQVVRQIVKGNQILDLAQQKHILSVEANERIAEKRILDEQGVEPNRPPYRLVGKRCIITDPITFTLADLKGIIVKLERS